jgi:methylmalonyl-CoA/ethylmalonyl-CoA epimerase
MITIKRVDHISMAHADWKAQSAWLERVLGFPFHYSFPAAPGDDFDGCVNEVPATDVEFEVISPIGGNGFVQKFLDQQGPGLHHITVEVPDILQAAEDLRALGIEPFGGIGDDGKWRVTYIHPRDTGGILWQLFVPHDGYPPAAGAKPAGLAGVRRMDHVSMAVPDLDRQVEIQQRVFGMALRGRWTDDRSGYHGAIMDIPNSKLQFEIIAPARADSFVQRFLDERRPGMHHICCEVASVDETAAALESAGIQPFGGVIRSQWKPHTFIHPRDSGGVLFQLFEEN